MQPKNLFTRKQQDTLLLFSDEEAPNIQPEVAEGYDDELLQRLIRHHHNIITKVTLCLLFLLQKCLKDLSQKRFHQSDELHRSSGFLRMCERNSEQMSL